MGLRLYNTLTGQKEDFVPFDPNNVRMYVCGPTVYDFAHIGNARPVIVFDVLYRLLRHLYGPEHVTYVRNITDVDDKINARAGQDFPDLPLNEAIRKVTETTEKQFHEDVAALGCLTPTYEPRATEFISRADASEDMIRLIEKLIGKGHAYVAEGHVLFSVASYPDYGRLARRPLDDMIAGARVEVAPYKRDPMDFVLWKPSKPGEPAWPSPWGMGRPGWHVECSAMAGALLGETFDIHGGGIDLVFPHHENEVAQSRCAHGTKLMAKYWIHNGFLQVEGKKMAKSEGNFVTIRDLLFSAKFGKHSWNGEILRLAMLKTHYRQPIDWTVSLLEEAEANLDRFAAVRYNYYPTELDERFQYALFDDLNTKLAIDILLELADAAPSDPSQGGRLVAGLVTIGILEEEIARLGEGWEVDEEGRAVVGPETVFRDVLALMPHNAPAKRVVEIQVNATNESGDRIFPHQIVSILKEAVRYASPSASAWDVFSNVKRQQRVNSLIGARISARAERNFAEADRIRAELDAMGVRLKDSKDPKTGELVTTWEVKR